MSRVWPICLMLVGCWYDPSHVDETGYLDGNDPGRGGLETDGDVDAPATDDAADLGVGEGIFITGTSVLSSTPGDVTVVGVPGALRVSHAELRVDGRDGGRTLALREGGFVVVVRAALGDELVFTDGAVELFRLTLGADLSDTDDFGVPGAATDSDTDLHPWPGDSQLAPLDGALPVGDGQIPGVPAPYLVYDLDLGTAVRVDVGDTDAVLTVAEGDAVCLALLGPGDLAGLSVCWTL